MKTLQVLANSRILLGETGEEHWCTERHCEAQQRGTEDLQLRITHPALETQPLHLTRAILQKFEGCGAPMITIKTTNLKHRPTLDKTNANYSTKGLAGRNLYPGISRHKKYSLQFLLSYTCLALKNNNKAYKRH